MLLSPHCGYGLVVKRVLAKDQSGVRFSLTALTEFFGAPLSRLAIGSTLGVLSEVRSQIFPCWEIPRPRLAPTRSGFRIPHVCLPGKLERTKLHLVLSEGFEPPTTASKAGMISISPRERT